MLDRHQYFHISLLLRTYTSTIPHFTYILFEDFYMKKKNKNGWNKRKWNWMGKCFIYRTAHILHFYQIVIDMVHSIAIIKYGLNIEKTLRICNVPMIKCWIVVWISIFLHFFLFCFPTVSFLQRPQAEREKAKREREKTETEENSEMKCANPA